MAAPLFDAQRVGSNPKRGDSPGSHQPAGWAWPPGGAAYGYTAGTMGNSGARAQFRHWNVVACICALAPACARPTPPPQKAPEATGHVAVPAPEPSEAQVPLQVPTRNASRLAFRGKRDVSFGTTGSTSIWQKSGEHRFKAVALGPDGVVYTVGHAPFTHGTDMAVARFDATGKLDATYGRGGVVQIGQRRAFGEAIAVDAQGKVVVAGYFYGKGGTNFIVARLSPHGTLDASFGTAGTVEHSAGQDNRAQAVHVRADGKLLISGYHGSDTNQVLCLEGDGTPCAQFGTAGVGLVRPVPGKRAFATRSALHGDGGIVLSGYLPSKDRMFVSRLDARGAPDAAFGTGGSMLLQDVAVGSAWALAVDSADRILVAGHAPSGPIVIARLRADGQIDESFGRNGLAVPLGASDEVYALLPLPSGHILGAGFRGLGDAAQPLFVLLTSDGAEERPSWVDDKAPRPSFIFGAALDARGRVVVAGDSPGDRWSAWVGRYD